jgi:transcriptional regulator with XRE-family HTH domain
MKLDPLYDPLGIGRRIRSARMQRGLRQNELARRIKAHVVSMSRWETGKTPVPARRVADIARVLGVSESYLRGESHAHVDQDPQDLRHGRSEGSAPRSTAFLDGRPQLKAWWYERWVQLFRSGVSPALLDIIQEETLRATSAWLQGAGASIEEVEDEVLVESWDALFSMRMRVRSQLEGAPQRAAG